MESPEHLHEETIQTYWDRQEPLYKTLYEEGAAQYVAGLSNLADAFELSDGVLRCIDERVEGGVHAAGSLVLLDEEEARRYCERAGVRGITSHAGCGAVKFAYLQERGLDQKTPVDPQVLDDYAIAQAKQLAEKLGLPYVGHIDSNQMKGPAGFHIARTVYYVGASDFNPHPVQELPPGFVISRRYLEKDYAVKEVELGISIALNEDHGFGKLITPENPLLVVAVSDPQNPELSDEALRAELEELVATYNGRVKLDGFAAPAIPVKDEHQQETYRMAA